MIDELLCSAVTIFGSSARRIEAAQARERAGGAGLDRAGRTGLPAAAGDQLQQRRAESTIQQRIVQHAALAVRALNMRDQRVRQIARKLLGMRAGCAGQRQHVGIRRAFAVAHAHHGDHGLLVAIGDWDCVEQLGRRDAARFAAEPAAWLDIGRQRRLEGCSAEWLEQLLPTIGCREGGQRIGHGVALIADSNGRKGVSRRYTTLGHGSTVLIIRTYAKAVLACGSMVLSFFCRSFFARRAKNDLQG